MIKIPTSVLAFAQDKIDIYLNFKDYYNHYRHDVEGNTTVKFNEKTSLDEKEKIMHGLFLEEVKRFTGMGAIFGEIPAEKMATNPLFQWAAFAVINTMIDMVLPDTILDKIGLFTDVRVGGYGDNFSFDVKPRDLFLISRAGRGKRRSEVQKQVNGQVTLTPVEHDVTVQVSLYKVLAGKESLAEFVMKATRSIETQMTFDAYDAFATAMNSLDNAGDDALRITGFTEATAIELAQKISAWNGGNRPVFVGTQLALAQIMPTDTNYRYQIDSEFVKLGYVRTFKGFDTMVLEQHADYTTPFKVKLDNTKLYVISPSAQKLVKLCIEGSTIAITDEPYANANLQQNTTLKKMWIAGIATNAIAGEIELS
jgi:hypothetical protein